MSPSAAATASGRSETIEFLLGQRASTPATDALASLPRAGRWKQRTELLPLDRRKRVCERGDREDGAEDAAGERGPCRPIRLRGGHVLEASPKPRRTQCV